MRSKKILSLIIVMAMLAAMLPTLALPAHAETYSGTCGDNLTWTLTEDGTLTISGTGAMEDYEGEDLAPWYYEREYIHTVVIESGVTSIGRSAFYWCDCLTSITIPDSVTSIGDSAFIGCLSLTSVTIPDSVANIGESVFFDCDSLTGIWVAANNPNYSNDANGVLFNKEKTMLHTVPAAISGSYTVPNGVTTIDSGAFRDCHSLTSVTISGSVISIGDYAFNHSFYGSNSLTEITFMGDAPSIADNAFFRITVTAYYPADNETWTEEVMQDYGGTINWVSYESDGNDENILASGTCGDNLTWTLTEDGTMTISGTGEMEDYEWGRYAPWYSEQESIYTVVIGSGVTSIGDFAFKWCDSLTNITIPDSVTSLGGYAFISCDSLTSITIPNSVTSIGYSTFSSCDSLTSITIPNSVTSIGDYAFSGCYSLTSIAIPDSVTSIGCGAFADCDSLTGIWVAANNPNYSNDANGVLFTKDETVLHTVPAAISGSYTISDSVTSIIDSAFEGCGSLKNITIPDSITTIGHFAFYDCYNLTSITIPDSVTSIGVYAFAQCDSLNEITFEGDAPMIGEEAFYNVTATAYYPAGNDTWTEEVMQDYSGDITWVPYDSEFEIMSGDVNSDGKINTTDAKLIMQYELGAIDENMLRLEAADVNGDGKINTTDAKLIMQLELGMITEFSKSPNKDCNSVAMLPAPAELPAPAKKKAP